MKKFLILFSIFFVGYTLGYIVKKSPSVVVNNISSSEELTDWQVMKMAIVKTESEFNELAVGKTNDWGILQITPIYVEEVNRILEEDKYTHGDAFSPSKSMAMFNIMQNHYNPENDIDKAITNHNPTASVDYLLKVRKNMEFVRKYEEIRSLTK